MINEVYTIMSFEGFVEYLPYLQNAESIDIKHFIEFIEPYFEKHGYRSLNANRILIIHDSGAGDLINASPVIREIRRLYPATIIDLILLDHCRELVRSCPYVDNVYTFLHVRLDTAIIDQFRYYSMIAEDILLNNYYSIVFNLGSYSRSYLLGYMSGALYQYGRQINDDYIFNVVLKKDLPLLTRNKEDFKIFGNHTVDKYLSVIDNILGIPINDRYIETWYSHEDKEYVDNILKDININKFNLYAIGVGGSGERKKWSTEQYAEMINMLIDAKIDEKAIYVVIGGLSDRLEAEKLLSHVHSKRVINLAGVCSFCQTAAFISNCVMYIGNDTSTMHIAAAENIPVLSPNCHPLDTLVESHIPVSCRPYGVPAVIVLPKHGLDECNNSADVYGCSRIKESHCIKQITIEKMLEGYAILMDLISSNTKETIFYS